MSTPNPILSAAESAAAPSLIAALQAIQTFITNMGTDPAQFALKFPGALQVLIGNLELQLPVLAASEITALQTEVNSKINGWISSLQALPKA